MHEMTGFTFKLRFQPSSHISCFVRSLLLSASSLLCRVKTAPIPGNEIFLFSVSFIHSQNFNFTPPLLTFLNGSEFNFFLSLSSFFPFLSLFPLFPSLPFFLSQNFNFTPPLLISCSKESVFTFILSFFLSSFVHSFILSHNFNFTPPLLTSSTTSLNPPLTPPTPTTERPKGRGHVPRQSHRQTMHRTRCRSGPCWHGIFTFGRRHTPHRHHHPRLNPLAEKCRLQPRSCSTECEGRGVGGGHWWQRGCV